MMEHVEDAALRARAKAQPLSLLDVGCGYGRYGALVRDSWNDAYIEGLDASLSGLRWNDAYDLLVEDVLPLADPSRLGLGHYDLVLLIDVIEHLTEPEGQEALAWCRRLGSTVVSTPNGYMEQDCGPADYETHRSGWTAADLWGLGAERVQTIPGRERQPFADMGSGQLVAYFPGP